jgi:hypothetical protein
MEDDHFWSEMSGRCFHSIWACGQEGGADTRVTVFELPGFIIWSVFPKPMWSPVMEPRMQPNVFL